MYCCAQTAHAFQAMVLVAAASACCCCCCYSCSCHGPGSCSNICRACVHFRPRVLFFAWCRFCPCLVCVASPACHFCPAIARLVLANAALQHTARNICSFAFALARCCHSPRWQHILACIQTPPTLFQSSSGECNRFGLDWHGNRPTTIGRNRCCSPRFLTKTAYLRHCDESSECETARQHKVAGYRLERTLMGCAAPLLRGVGAPHQCPRVNQKRSGWGEFVTYLARFQHRRRVLWSRSRRNNSQ